MSESAVILDWVYVAVTAVTVCVALFSSPVLIVVEQASRHSIRLPQSPRPACPACPAEPRADRPRDVPWCRRRKKR